MTDMVRISHSRVKAWRRCHKLHDYRFNQRLSPRLKPLPMFRGVMVAKLLEIHYGGGKWVSEWNKYKEDYDRLMNEEKEEYGDLPNDVFSIVERYIEHYHADGLDYVAVEKKWEFEYEGMMIVAKLDALVRDEKGRLWLLERKVPKKIPDEDARISDLQTVLYYQIHTLSEGQKPHGILWDYVRAKLPTVPDVLKSGELSKAKKIDTDYETYLKAINDNDLEPADYAEFLSSLEGREENFMRRIYLPRPNAVLVDNVWKDFVQTGQEIVHLGETLVDRNMYDNCKQCEMYRLCKIEVRGDDASFVRKADYVQGALHNEEGNTEAEPDDSDEESEAA